jgi:hypothetical protein
MALQPMAASAQTDLAVDGVPSWVTEIENYQNRLTGTLLKAGDLLEAMEGLQSAAPPGLTEAQVMETREQAQFFADEIAGLMGAVDDLAGGLSKTGMGSPSATDVILASAEPLPEGLVQDLLDQAGVPESQLSAIANGFEQLFQRRNDLAQEGLSAELDDLLRGLGYSESELQAIAAGLSEYGMLNPELPDRRDQFRAGQQELAIARSGALALSVQLVGLQIQVRQTQGVPATAVSGEDLGMLAEDQLRLLVHIAHLQALWGDDPALSQGLGEWWFIERYADRAAERIEALILDSHNRGLATDLYLLLLVENLAKTARLGNPNIVKAELDWLGEVLAVRSGNSVFLAQQRNDIRAPGLALIRASAHPWVREYVRWPLPVDEIGTTAEVNRIHLQEWSNAELSRNPAIESNLSNNSFGIVFIVGYTLDEGTLVVAREVMNAVWRYVPHDEASANIFIGLLEVMVGLGEPDNPAEFLVLILSSFIPVVDSVQDLITIVREEDPFIRVIASLSLIASLGELSYLLGVTAPIGAASTLTDASLASVRGLYGTSDEAFQAIMKGMKYDEAFELGAGLMRVTTKSMLDEGLTLGDDAVEVITDVMTQGAHVWDNFVPYVKVVNGKDVAILIELGFDEGGMLIGQMMRMDGLVEEALSPGVIRYLDEVGDGLFVQGVRFSDESAGGLTVFTRTLPEDDLRILIGELGGACGVVAIGGPFKLASPVRSGFCDPEEFGRIAKNMDVIRADTAAIDGYEKLVNIGIPAKGQAHLLIQFADQPIDLQMSLRSIHRSSFTGFTVKQVESSGLLVANARILELEENFLDYLPLNSLAEGYYPAFGARLLSSFEDQGYVYRNLDSINASLRSGDRQSILGHMGNIVGEYREVRALDLLQTQIPNTRPIYSHVTAAGNVNAAGIDVLLLRNDGYVIVCEIKDRGISAGLFLDVHLNSTAIITSITFLVYEKEGTYH